MQNGLYFMVRSHLVFLFTAFISVSQLDTFSTLLILVTCAGRVSLVNIVNELADMNPHAPQYLESAITHTVCGR